MADALTEYRGMLNKMVGSTDTVEVGALEQEVAHRLGLMFASGTDTAGAPTFATAVHFDGATTVRTPVAVTASDTLVAADSGKVYAVTSNTAGVTLTLPATAAGLVYHFIVAAIGDTAADFVIKPAAVDQIIADNNATTAPVDKDGLFADASDTTSDAGRQSITLVGDGSLGWYAVAQRGTWKANTNP